MNLWFRLLRKRNTQANDGDSVESLEARDIGNHAVVLRGENTATAE
jgi:hypothetical protein